MKQKGRDKAMTLSNTTLAALPPECARPAGLYIHWPFCESKCPYCDFNSHVAQRIDLRAWADAYEIELQRYFAEFPDIRISSIFFGGGTPSLMPPALAGGIIETIRRLWVVNNDVEITLEANPSSVELGRFRHFRDCGINRISVGVQALDDAALRLLGRRHTVFEARAALETAMALFPRVSADLIYARQHQTPKQWENELKTALAIGTGHLSLYQLTIEEGTVFAARQARGILAGLPDEDRAASMYEMTRDICAAGNMPAYEISNHARRGEECQHNLTYWRSGMFVGVGPGAHGRLYDGAAGSHATVAHRDPSVWLAAVHSIGSGEKERTRLSAAEIGDEFVLMGLRLREGISQRRYRALSGRALDPKRIAELVDMGVLAQLHDHISLTPKGVLLANTVIAHLLAEPQGCLAGPDGSRGC